MAQSKMDCIIPARGGSKGIQGKNVRDFCGKPLIAWTIEAALSSEYLNRVIVSTDDAEIERVSLKYGAEIIKRPDDLATDTASTADVVSHVLQVLNLSESESKPFMLLQCTSPLRGTQHINEACKKFLSNKDADSLVSVRKVEFPPWWYKTIDKDGMLNDFIKYDKSKYTRRQDFQDVYALNGAIYIVRVQAFYKYHDFDAGNVIPYIMNEIDSTDIDTETDFICAEQLMKNRYK